MQVIHYPTGYSLLAAKWYNGQYLTLTGNCGKYGTTQGLNRGAILIGTEIKYEFDIPLYTYSHGNHEPFGRDTYLHDHPEHGLSVSFGGFDAERHHPHTLSDAISLMTGKKFKLSDVGCLGYNADGVSSWFRTHCCEHLILGRGYASEHDVKSISSDTHAVMTSPTALAQGLLLFGPTKFQAIKDYPGIKKGCVVVYRRGGDFRIMKPDSKTHPKHLVMSDDSLTFCAYSKSVAYVIDLDI